MYTQCNNFKEQKNVSLQFGIERLLRIFLHTVNFFFLFSIFLEIMITIVLTAKVLPELEFVLIIKYLILWRIF